VPLGAARRRYGLRGHMKAGVDWPNKNTGSFIQQPPAFTRAWPRPLPTARPDQIERGGGFPAGYTAVAVRGGGRGEPLGETVSRTCPLWDPVLLQAKDGWAATWAAVFKKRFRLPQQRKRMQQALSAMPEVSVFSAMSNVRNPITKAALPPDICLRACGSGEAPPHFRRSCHRQKVQRALADPRQTRVIPTPTGTPRWPCRGPRQLDGLRPRIGGIGAPQSELGSFPNR